MTPHRKRLFTLAAAYGVPVCLFLSGGAARPFAWLAVVTAMALLWRQESKDGTASPPEWGRRFTMTAFVLAGILAYNGLSAAEADRTLRREMALVCGHNVALCDRLDAARASADDASHIAGGED